MKKYIIILGAMLMLLSCTSTKKVVNTEPQIDLVKSQEAINLFTEGQLAEMSNDFNNALRYYYKALLKDSSNTVVLNAISNAHIKLEHYGNAVLYLQRSAMIDENNVETWILLGEAWLGQKKFNESADAFEKASNIQPQNMSIRRYLIYIYTTTGNRDQLLNQYLDILNRIGFDPDMAVKAADLLFQVGNTGQAENIYSRLLEADPQNIAAIMGLAQIDVFKGDTLQAEEKYQKAMKIQPGNSEIDFNYGRLLRQKHDWDGLVSFYQKKLDSDSSSNMSRISLAEALYWKGEYEKAREVLLPYYGIDGLHEGITQLIGKVETMLKNYDVAKKYLYISKAANPNDPGIYFDLVYCLDENNQSDSAIVVLEEAVEKFDKEPLFYRYLGQLYSNNKDYNKAINVLEKSLKLEVNDVVSLSILANLFFEKGDYYKSDSTYEKALTIDPENATILNNYAYGLADRDTLLQRAHKMSKTAIEKEPDNASFLDTIAWILYKMNNQKEAADYIKRALANDKEAVSEELYYHAGMIFTNIDREKAIEFFRIALKRNPESTQSQQALEKLENNSK